MGNARGQRDKPNNHDKSANLVVMNRFNSTNLKFVPIYMCWLSDMYRLKLCYSRLWSAQCGTVRVLNSRIQEMWIKARGRPFRRVHRWWMIVIIPILFDSVASFVIACGCKSSFIVHFFLGFTANLRVWKGCVWKNSVQFVQQRMDSQMSNYC